MMDWKEAGKGFGAFSLMVVFIVMALIVQGA